MINPWKVLGVHRKSTDEEIRNVYIELAKKHHPDMKKGNADKFHDISLAYSFIRNKDERKDLLEKLEHIFGTPKCKKCAGAGVLTKSKGITGKVYTACTACSGSGLIFKNQEEENVAIELHGTAGSNGKGRNKGGRSGTSKQRKH